MSCSRHGTGLLALITLAGCASHSPVGGLRVAKLYLQDRPFAVIHTQLAGAECIKPI